MNKVELREHPLGFLQVHPKPTQKELNDFYEKSYYQAVTSATYQNEYDADELRYIFNKIAQKSAIVERIISEPASLLDVGCGEGFLMAHFAKKKWKVTGIDFSDFGIAKFNPDLLSSFIKGDIYQILDEKIKNGERYDLVWLGNVLEHVLEPLDLLSRLQKLLDDNGLLVISVPNDSSKYQDFLIDRDLVKKKWWIAFPDHLSYFNYESLLKISSFVGFHCEDLISDFPIDFFLLHPGSNYINQPAAGKDAHRARVLFENFIADRPVEEINVFYSQLAKLGLGRDLTVFLTKKVKPVYIT